VVFHVLDAAELDFPFRHTTLFRGLEGLPEVLTDPPGVRDSYLKALHAHLDALEAGCRGMEIDYVRLRTDADLGHDLAAYLQKRRGKYPHRKPPVAMGGLAPTPQECSNATPPALRSAVRARAATRPGRRQGRLQATVQRHRPHRLADRRRPAGHEGL